MAELKKTLLCRYCTKVGSGNVPLVDSSGEYDTFLPCSDVTGQERPASLGGEVVEEFRCASQRAAGLCPRRLTSDVDPSLSTHKPYR